MKRSEIIKLYPNIYDRNDCIRRFLVDYPDVPIENDLMQNGRTPIRNTSTED